MASANGNYVNELANDFKYPSNEENLIDYPFYTDDSQLKSNLNENNFLKNNIFISNRDTRSFSNDFEEKFSARSKFFKVQPQDSFIKNNNGNYFLQSTIKPDLQSNNKKHLYNQTSMKIECLFSVKNCMTPIEKEDAKKMKFQKMLVDKNYRKNNIFYYNPYFTTWKVKKDL
uniref:Uncharacterized protein n=1 Tax=Strongyloides stercoralis TaxID=6248 RepID=A0A0K0E8S3_STRER